MEARRQFQPPSPKTLKARFRPSERGKYSRKGWRAWRSVEGQGGGMGLFPRTDSECVESRGDDKCVRKYRGSLAAGRTL